MRVVHLMGALRASGMERMFISGAPHFLGSGIRSTIVGQGHWHPFGPELASSGYEIRTIASVRTVAGLSAWAATLREVDPDVVHIHTEEAFAAVILLAHRQVPHARIIRTFHSYYEATGWWAAKRRLQAALSDRYVDAFVAPSTEVARHEWGFGRRCQVISNWVDERFTNGSGNTPLGADLLVVGNCEAVKTHETALACALRNNWTVAHIGDESRATAYETGLLEQLEQRGLLVSRGVADPHDHMLTARLFVLPSEREGFSVALAEAVAIGMTCVVSDIRGNAWARQTPLVNTVTGQTPEDWDSALARAFATRTAVSTRQAARLLASEQLSPAVGVSQYCALYRAE